MKDWIAEAAEEIDNESFPDAYGTERIVEIIRRHSPFKDGVAYMPVPRCDGCSHWERREHQKHVWSRCLLSLESNSKLATIDEGGGIQTAADFGCVQFETLKGAE